VVCFDTAGSLDYLPDHHVGTWCVSSIVSTWVSSLEWPGQEWRIGPGIPELSEYLDRFSLSKYQARDSTTVCLAILVSTSSTGARSSG
jgi:hypothetical protein